MDCLFHLPTKIHTIRQITCIIIFSYHILTISNNHINSAAIHQKFNILLQMFTFFSPFFIVYSVAIYVEAVHILFSKIVNSLSSKAVFFSWREVVFVFDCQYHPGPSYFCACSVLCEKEFLTF